MVNRSVEILDEIDALVAELRVLLGDGDEANGEWAYPVGTPKYPTTDWYAATLHDPTGKLNSGYGHTGIDLNVDKKPWGDVDRGQPVYAIADGVVHRVHYSTSYLGSTVIQVEHDGAPLWLRYWHLENDVNFRVVSSWTRIEKGDLLGHIGNYTLGAGGDHLHLDAALDPFEPHWWFTYHPEVRWVDPVPILKEHLDPALVDEMLRRR